MCFVLLSDLPFFWPFCEAYTRIKFQGTHIRYNFNFNKHDHVYNQQWFDNQRLKGTSNIDL